MRTLGLVLAAGESKRLGQAKQLVQFQDQYLLSRTINVLSQLLPQVHVVLGANHELIQQHINIEHPIINTQWSKGMGHSLAYGIQQLHPCDAVLIALCDQALIPQSHYQNLILNAQQHPKHIIATQHQTLGVPTVFPHDYFDELSSLKGAQGAKALIQKHRSNTLALTCPTAAFDVDTPKQLLQLKKKEQ